MSLRRIRLVLALLCAGVIGLTACSSAGSAGPSTVRLLAHESFVVSEQLIADLKAQTGITLEVVTAGDAGSMVAGAILAAGAPTADVIFGIDNTLISRAVGAGVLEPYTAADASSLIPELQGDTAGGMVTPIDYGDVCVNIDDTWFADKGITAPATSPTSRSRSTWISSSSRTRPPPRPASPSSSPRSPNTATPGPTTGLRCRQTASRLPHRGPTRTPASSLRAVVAGLAHSSSRTQRARQPRSSTQPSRSPRRRQPPS